MIPYIYLQMQTDDPIAILRESLATFEDAKTAKKRSFYQIAKMLRKRREAAKMSLRSMAKLLDISPPFLSDLETGARPWSEERITSYLNHLS